MTARHSQPLHSPRLPRFFVEPGVLEGEQVTLGGAAAHQVRHVLRMQPGERIILLDNSGREFEVELAGGAGGTLHGRVLESRPSPREPRVRLTLYPALLKHDKLEWLLQKGTELGVAAFQPVLCERSVRGEAGAQKLERWQRIVREAAEQSERGILPALSAAEPFALAVGRADPRGLTLIPYEGERTRSLRAVLRERPETTCVSLFIGPEGGFSAGEIELACAHHGLPVTLGPRILRAETAGLAAAAAVLFALGEME